ncbi:Rpp14/Pop5 family protein [Vulcanisaeta thermophila]|uniref:Rpp14/Pop5 family protein n=1 Tax=Vulcanisaeta thermophila TaxID=867917 RepID=UPI000852F410|nr:Rpp14/Pop5 family protein [Vulcanisaeta thermophila]
MARVHNRYLVLSVYPPEYLGRVLGRLNEVFKQLAGKDALGVNVRVYDTYPGKGFAVLGVPRNLVNVLRASTCIVRDVDGARVMVLTVKVTGTLRRARAIAQSINLMGL